MWIFWGAWDMWASETMSLLRVIKPRPRVMKNDKGREDRDVDSFLNPEGLAVV